MYVRCDESSLYSRINYVHSPDGELLVGGLGILKWCTQGLHAYVSIVLCQRPGADNGKKTDVMIEGKDLCVSLNAQ